MPTVTPPPPPSPPRSSRTVAALSTTLTLTVIGLGITAWYGLRQDNTPSLRHQDARPTPATDLGQGIRQAVQDKIRYARTTVLVEGLDYWSHVSQQITAGTTDRGQGWHYSDVFGTVRLTRPLALTYTPGTPRQQVCGAFHVTIDRSEHDHTDPRVRSADPDGLLARDTTLPVGIDGQHPFKGFSITYCWDMAAQVANERLVTEAMQRCLNRDISHRDLSRRLALRPGEQNVRWQCGPWYMSSTGQLMTPNDYDDEKKMQATSGVVALSPANITVRAWHQTTFSGAPAVDCHQYAIALEDTNPVRVEANYMGFINIGRSCPAR